MSRRDYRSDANRGGYQNRPHAGVREATCEEDVIEGVRRMNEKVRRSNRDKAEADARANISLSPVLDEWLKRPIPGDA